MVHTAHIQRVKSVWAYTIGRETSGTYVSALVSPLIFSLHHITSSFWKILVFSSVFIKMDFRRIPFQFSSTDLEKRQAELQKRFGLPVNKDKDKMHVDFANPGLMVSLISV